MLRIRILKENKKEKSLLIIFIINENKSLKLILI